MKKLLVISLFLHSSILPFIAANKNVVIVDQFPNILDISYTPDSIADSKGLFTDAGSWMGFTIPSSTKWVNGFCGPFTIDSRLWVSKSLAEVGVVKNGKVFDATGFLPDSSSYYPGFINMSSSYNDVVVRQQLCFIDKNHAILQLTSSALQWIVRSTTTLPQLTLRQDGNCLVLQMPNREIVTITFPADFTLAVTDKSYSAKSKKTTDKVYVLISFYANQSERVFARATADNILRHPQPYIAQSKARWNGYLSKTLRKNRTESDNRIAVKSVVTLVSNWRSAKGDLLHDGVVPSHAVGYFVGFWAWDSWKHAVALARFAPDLAKNQVRAMFDYQTDEGMIIDCIYSNKKENNARDSKPPLAAWAVMEIYKQTKDSAFVREMFPKLLKYNRWWFTHRDHDQNGICEFGSTDGTTEAAKWESGMDNAVRFDSATMVKNLEGAWSFNQESVDLNAFLFLENYLLKELAALLKLPYSDVFDAEKNDRYFFDSTQGYYYDRKLKGGFVAAEGSEGYIPMWTKMASRQHAAVVLKMYEKTNKFSTYIPFPTLCADHPAFSPNGYWRGPIWLDQVYFGISGLRNYGYSKQADDYTNQVFERLNDLKGQAPIHENYDTHTGNRLKAPHFSWSAAHLLMLYWEYGK